MVNEYTFYVPHEEPRLRKKEKETLEKGEGYIKRLHLARPAFLHVDDKGNFQHDVISSSKTRYLIAELEKSDQIVLFQAHELFRISPKINSNIRREYFIDIYFEPIFGAIHPKEILFVPLKEMDDPLNSYLLFSSIKKI